jgi:hypothetical protein
MRVLFFPHNPRPDPPMDTSGWRMTAPYASVGTNAATGRRCLVTIVERPFWGLSRRSKSRLRASSAPFRKMTFTTLTTLVPAISVQVDIASVNKVRHLCLLELHWTRQTDCSFLAARRPKQRPRRAAPWRLRDNGQSGTISMLSDYLPAFWAQSSKQAAVADSGAKLIV